MRKAINSSPSHLSRGFTLRISQRFFPSPACPHFPLPLTLPSHFSAECRTHAWTLAPALCSICLANQRRGPLSRTYLVNDFSFSLRSRDHQLIEALMDGPSNLYACTSVYVCELTDPLDTTPTMSNQIFGLSSYSLKKDKEYEEEFLLINNSVIEDLVPYILP